MSWKSATRTFQEVYKEAELTHLTDDELIVIEDDIRKIWFKLMFKNTLSDGKIMDEPFLYRCNHEALNWMISPHKFRC